ncbi:MAG: class I SAM-dependent methyltransferase [Thermoleophilaceae bacterium]|nr:class I SAM-dependent methyltransferase [Thermoleophilaceae bacterium]
MGRLRLLIEALAAEPDPPTTERTPAAALRAHVADSLSGLEARELGEARRIADIGAGAGFPGLVLAVALPQAQVDLVEAGGRKADVIERLARHARVANARAVRARAEEWGAAPAAAGGGAGGYDAVTARAVGPLALLLEYAAPLLREGGALVAWKGVLEPPEQEAAATAAAELGMEILGARPVEPFEGARHRTLHLSRKVAPTPARFPRRAGAARKRPLG